MDNAIGFSTISIRLIQPVVPAADSIMDGVAYNFRSGWNAFFKLIVNAIQLCAWLSPFIILAVIIALLLKKANKQDLLTFWKKGKK